MQWQVSVLMANGATVLFGVQASSKIEAERLAFERAPSGTILSLAVTVIPAPPRLSRLHPSILFLSGFQCVRVAQTLPEAVERSVRVQEGHPWPMVDPSKCGPVAGLDITGIVGYAGGMETSEWVAYWPLEGVSRLQAYGLPLPGDRVRTRRDLSNGINEGHYGTMVAFGRSVKANHDFMLRKAQAATIGRKLNASDYEMLIDEEGPVVLWDGETVPRWHPGQSDPTELVDIAY